MFASINGFIKVFLLSIVSLIAIGIALLFIAIKTGYYTSYLLNQSIKEYKYFQNELPFVLAESENYRDNLVATLLAMDGESTLAKHESPLQKALLKAPNEPLLLISILQFCKKTQKQPFCDKQDFEKKYQTSEPNNALPWLIAASTAQEKGDSAKVIEYLHKASTAKFYNSYYSEFIALFSNAIEPHTSYVKIQVHVAAIGYSVGQSLSFTWLQEVCLAENEYERSSEHIDLCNKIGYLIESTGTSWIDVRLGLAIQKKTIHIYSDQEKRLTELTNRRAENQRFHQRYFAVMPKVPFDDDEIAESLLFIDDLIEVGEIEAMTRSIKRLTLQSK